MAAVAALPDDAEICGCNGVCKGKITSTIVSKGLTTLDDVRAHTKASASCGSCTGLVEQLMAITLGRHLQSGRRDSRCAAAPISAMTMSAA
jgi:nitrite reductase (NADH) large subunit